MPTSSPGSSLSGTLERPETDRDRYMTHIFHCAPGEVRKGTKALCGRVHPGHDGSNPRPYTAPTPRHCVVCLHLNGETR